MTFMRACRGSRSRDEGGRSMAAEEQKLERLTSLTRVTEHGG